ncbi:hypothetical protein BZL30_3877 [Mycobacterium kansasii]|uniref:Uncharacterized protein n=1 Tax=Mycobacterium kansasii TaxID=1768 RepID=A0A1V3XBD7_MYCKA|nr:hypothetical protein BZL30_3877 [Mycobacterium kansasii]
MMNAAAGSTRGRPATRRGLRAGRSTFGCHTRLRAYVRAL